MPAGDLTRLVAAALALAAGVAAVVIVALLLSHTPGPVSTAAAAPAAPASQAPVATTQHVPIRAAFPAPPAHAVVFARADGSNVLALAARPRGRPVVLPASPLRP